MKGKGNSRLAEQERILHEQVDFAIKNKIKRIIYAGDIFHTSNPTSVYRSIFIDVLLRCIHHGVNIILLVGNHDYNQSGVSALEPIKRALGDKIIVVDEPMVIGDFLCAPHYSPSKSTEYWDKVFALAEEHKPKYGIGHFHAIGAITGTEQRMLIGGELTVKELPDLSRWILGHIHKPQSLVIHGTQVEYTGSIVRVDAGERTDTKSFMLLDTDKNEIERIPINCTQYIQLDLDESEVEGCNWSKVKDKILKVNVFESVGKYGVRDIEELAKENGVLMIKSVVFNRKDKQTMMSRDKAIVDMSPEKATTRYFKEHKKAKDITAIAVGLLREVINGKAKKEVTT
jgi:DNA repair exonuclease SbcCD nuclease subunit